MAAQITGLLNQLSAAHHLNNAQPVKNQATASSSSGDDSATITANDFLTLLVTEMKNQDPTANTDPNEYINQLVQVNSLRATHLDQPDAHHGFYRESRQLGRQTRAEQRHRLDDLAAALPNGNLTRPREHAGGTARR